MDQERIWVEQARAGDQAAFARLVAAYQGPVFNLAYRMLGNPGDAEDAAQETFLRAYDRLGSYEIDRKFSSWILSIASHYCIDQLRRRRLPLESLDDMPVWRDLPSDDQEPEDAALQGEQERALQHALAQLPPAYRLPVILRYWNDLSYEEIAEATQSTVSAIKSRLHRARLMLAEALEVGATTPRRPQPANLPLTPKGPVTHALRAS
jgi:RNA polymerase sigma-70 factor (ECF subfamily)